MNITAQDIALFLPRIGALAAVRGCVHVARRLARTIDVGWTSSIQRIDGSWYVATIGNPARFGRQHELHHDDLGEMNGVPLCRVHRWGFVVLAEEWDPEGWDHLYILDPRREVTTPEGRETLDAAREALEAIRDLAWESEQIAGEA